LLRHCFHALDHPAPQGGNRFIIVAGVHGTSAQAEHHSLEALVQHFRWTDVEQMLDVRAGLFSQRRAAVARERLL